MAKNLRVRTTDFSIRRLHLEFNRRIFREKNRHFLRVTVSFGTRGKKLHIFFPRSPNMPKARASECALFTRRKFAPKIFDFAPKTSALFCCFSRHSYFPRVFEIVENRENFIHFTFRLLIFVENVFTFFRVPPKKMLLVVLPQSRQP